MCDSHRFQCTGQKNKSHKHYKTQRDEQGHAAMDVS